MKTSKIVVLVLLAIGLIDGASLAEARLLDIRVDLNANASTPANWNVVADPSNTSNVYSLIDFNTGLATDGVRLQITKAFGDSAGNLSYGLSSWSNPAAPWVDVNVLADYAFLGNQSGQITLSGLDPMKKYQVELLSVRSTDDPANPATTSLASYTVNAMAGVGIDGGLTSAWHAGTDGYVGRNFMLWNAVTPYSNGRILIDVATSGNYAYLNGLRVSEIVPEPATIWLLGLGLLGLIGLGWRRG